MTKENSNRLKILYGYPYYPAADTYGDTEKVELEYLERLKQNYFNVEGFCLTLDPPSQCLTFKELDRKWKYGDKQLLKMYEKLARALENKDVLINAAGINLHPEFVQELSVFTVFQCFDDPENSDNLSKPVAASYDLCLVGNVAELETYKSWGVKNVEWTTLSINEEMYDHTLTYEKIITESRDIDLFMMIDRLAPWRKERLDKIAKAFPKANFYGNGWNKGFLKKDDEVEYLRRAKIGPNIHNSTGPINLRTFYLPANGVLQICDNKNHLGKLFALNEEVIGFDTIEECIDLCNYYLTHEEERRKIAANGWKRAVNDYNEFAVFNRKLNVINKYYLDRKIKSIGKISVSSEWFLKNKIKKIIYFLIIKPFLGSTKFFISSLRKQKSKILKLQKKYKTLF